MLQQIITSFGAKCRAADVGIVAPLPGACRMEQVLSPSNEAGFCHCVWSRCRPCAVCDLTVSVCDGSYCFCEASFALGLCGLRVGQLGHKCGLGLLSFCCWYRERLHDSKQCCVQVEPPL